jgi:hypothetical protein
MLIKVHYKQYKLTGGNNMDRLTTLMHRRVAYTMTDEPKQTYIGTVERDSYGRAYIQDENEVSVIVYDTGILQDVKEI